MKTKAKKAKVKSKIKTYLFLRDSKTDALLWLPHCLNVDELYKIFGRHNSILVHVSKTKGVLNVSGNLRTDIERVLEFVKDYGKRHTIFCFFFGQGEVQKVHITDLKSGMLYVFSRTHDGWIKE